MRSDDETPDDLLYEAWCVIANSGVFGNPSEATPGCREAAIRWRDKWHATLADLPPAAGVGFPPNPPKDAAK